MDVHRVSRVFNAPLRYVYEWCTDYRETDPKITGSTRQRIILEKTKKRAIYVQLYDGADGKRKVCLDIVTLKPPNSWHLDFFGEEDDETGEYRLTSLGKEKTRLDMTFREKWKKIARIPTIEEQVRSSNKVWEKYAVALEQDYRSRKKREA